MAAKHSHLLRDDLRGPLLPTDRLSHISRINDWKGSDSWVEGCRKDKAMMSEPKDYPEPELPYRLLSPAYHKGTLRRASEVVYLRPSERGPHHAKLPDVEYPPEATETPAWGHQAPKFNDDGARIAILESVVVELQRKVAELRHEPMPVGLEPSEHHEDEPDGPELHRERLNEPPSVWEPPPPDAATAADMAHEAVKASAQHQDGEPQREFDAEVAPPPPASVKSPEPPKPASPPPHHGGLAPQPEPPKPADDDL